MLSQQILKADAPVVKRERRIGLAKNCFDRESNVANLGVNHPKLESADNVAASGVHASITARTCASEIEILQPVTSEIFSSRAGAYSADTADPFDRLMIAQALNDGMPFLSSDPEGFGAITPMLKA